MVVPQRYNDVLIATMHLAGQPSSQQNIAYVRCISPLNNLMLPVTALMSAGAGTVLGQCWDPTTDV